MVTPPERDSNFRMLAVFVPTASDAPALRAEHLTVLRLWDLDLVGWRLDFVIVVLPFIALAISSACTTLSPEAGRAHRMDASIAWKVQ